MHTIFLLVSNSPLIRHSCPAILSLLYVAVAKSGNLAAWRRHEMHVLVEAQKRWRDACVSAAARRRRRDAAAGGTTGGERQAVAVQHDKAMVKQLHVWWPLMPLVGFLLVRPTMHGRRDMWYQCKEHVIDPCVRTIPMSKLASSTFVSLQFGWVVLVD
jgi:hypothetical protein